MRHDMFNINVVAYHRPELYHSPSHWLSMGKRTYSDIQGSDAQGRKVKIYHMCSPLQLFGKDMPLITKPILNKYYA